MPWTAPMISCRSASSSSRCLEMTADVARVLLQALVTQDVEHGKTDALTTGLPPAEEKK